MKKGIILGIAAFLVFAFSPLAIAEDALEDANHVPGLLGHYNSATKQIRADESGNIYVNTSAYYGVTNVIDGVTLDDSPTSTTSVSLELDEYKKICFLILYDETEVGNSVSGTLTIEVSPDEVYWLDCDLIIDQNGVNSPQGSLTYTQDDEDVCYIPSDFIPKYLRVIFTGTNTDADDIILIRVWACYQN